MLLQMSEVQIKQYEYFEFSLPGGAFGFPDSIVITFSVRYIEAVNEPKYVVNVWANLYHEENVKRFVYAAKIPLSKDPLDSIMGTLNASSTFHDSVCRFVRKATRHSSR